MPGNWNQTSLGNIIDNPSELHSDNLSPKLRESEMNGDPIQPEQVVSSGHSPNLGEVFPETIEPPTRKTSHTSPALMRYGTAIEQPKIDDTSHNNFPPVDRNFSAMVSDDVDMEYWVRLAEGPGHPAYSQPDDFTSAYSAQTFYDEGSTALTDDWSLGRDPWQQESSLNSLKQIMEQGVQQTISERDDEGMKPGRFDGCTACDSKVTMGLSNRQGYLQIAEDGVPRYYGASSTMLHHGPNAITLPLTSRIETHGKAAITQANLDWPGDSNYEEQLINLFFVLHNPYMNIVDRDAYHQAREAYANGKSTLLYSLCLTNAM